MPAARVDWSSARPLCRCPWMSGTLVLSETVHYVPASKLTHHPGSSHIFSLGTWGHYCPTMLCSALSGVKADTHNGDIKSPVLGRKQRSGHRRLWEVSLSHAYGPCQPNGHLAVISCIHPAPNRGLRRAAVHLRLCGHHSMRHDEVSGSWTLVSRGTREAVIGVAGISRVITSGFFPSMN